MSKLTGTIVRGLIAPIFKEGDDLENIVSDTLLNFLEKERVEIGSKDILAITESVVARAQGNYVDLDDVCIDLKSKFKNDIGVVFPILSRNRFSLILKAIARAAKNKVTIMLMYPSDEVGNHLVSLEKVDECGLNPYVDVLSEKDFRKYFGSIKHSFTGIDYIEFYREIVEKENKECEIIFSNNAKTILDYCDEILVSDIHSRKRTKRLLKDAKTIYSLDEILNKPINGSGYSEYGLLGSNKATEEKLKLFPRESSAVVKKIQAIIKEKTGKKIEVMVYGDGAFKDPVGKIWEFADPVVSPGYTEGLKGVPNEVKLKYLADNDFKDLHGDELKKALIEAIKNKGDNLVQNMLSQGTTPREITDLLGSLCDLTSGSGDKGTPIVYIQGYFDNFSK